MTERTIEIAEYALDKGKHDAAFHFGIEVSTVERKVRAYYQHTRDPEPQPKILIFDIETLPIVAVTWGVWNVNISPVNILQDWSLLSYSYKWLSDENVDGDVLTPTEAVARDDKRITEGIWELLNEADVVIGYNSIKFDERKMNAKFLEHGLGKPSPYKSIDLYQAAKRMFANTFNKMDWVNKVAGIDRKLENAGMKLWIGCHEGDKKSLDTMMEYNLVDTEITEQLYIRILDWIPNHPNMALYFSDEEPMCHKCASTDVVLTDRKHYTSASVFDLYHCPHCNSYSRAKKRSATTELRPV